MNDNIERDDNEIAQLLRAAGPRPRPNPDATAAARAAVEAEWRSVVAGRSRQRRYSAWAAMAATVGTLAMGWWLVSSEPVPQEGLFATVETHTGTVERLAAGSRQWTPLAAGAGVSTGDRLRTGTTGRVAFAIDGGPALRLDHDTLAIVAAATRLELSHGAIYVDSRESASELVIDTRIGAVTHIGTRYQARVDDIGLTVAVRDGEVRIARDAGTEQARGGEQLFLSAAGESARTGIAGHAAEWAWADSVAPAPAIDGLTLHEFVGWAAHETGRELRFATPEAEQAARETVLHGSVAGLSPAQALAAMMRTTTLQHEANGGEVVLRMAPAPR
jgi:ferric-dicitrate binding protein FerR (iron transport regulator)